MGRIEPKNGCQLFWDNLFPRVGSAQGTVPERVGNRGHRTTRGPPTPAMEAEGQPAWTSCACYRCANNGCGSMATNVDGASFQQDVWPVQRTEMDSHGPTHSPEKRKVSAFGGIRFDLLTYPLVSVSGGQPWTHGLGVWGFTALGCPLADF